MIPNNDIIHFIRLYKQEFDVCPTIERIADRFSVNKNAIFKRVQTLVKEGRLEKFNGKIRLIS